MTQANANKFIKRIQSDLKRKGISATMGQCREVYLSLVTNPENPNGEEVKAVTEAVKNQLSTTIYQAPPNNVELVLIDETDVQASTEEDLEIQKPAITEITPESNPDIWETLQPPAETSTELPTESALVKAEETKLASAPGAIPQDEVKGMVASVFAGQPTEFTNQVTDYALQHSFENVRQIQDFLEQLRSMEFNLLIQTLNDHATRRGSMLTVLNQVLDGQRQQDQEKRDSFFGSFQTRMTNFQKEMEAKLAKQSI